MTDPVQEFYHPEPVTVGICVVCKRDIDDYERSVEDCDCGSGARHKDCMVACYACGYKGCKSCLEAEDATGEYLCKEQDYRDKFTLMLEKKEWEDWQRGLEKIKKSIAGEMDLVGREIDRINQKLKEYG